MNEIKKALAAAEKKSIRIGGTLHVLIGTADEIDAAFAKLKKKARAAMLRGADVEADGVVTWIEDVEAFPTVWDPKDGNRSVHRRTIFTKTADGTLTKTVEKTFFRRPDLGP